MKWLKINDKGTKINIQHIVEIDPNDDGSLSLTDVASVIYTVEQDYVEQFDTLNL